MAKYHYEIKTNKVANVEEMMKPGGTLAALLGGIIPPSRLAWELGRYGVPDPNALVERLKPLGFQEFRTGIGVALEKIDSAEWRAEYDRFGNLMKIEVVGSNRSFWTRLRWTPEGGWEVEGEE